VLRTAVLTRVGLPSEARRAGARRENRRVTDTGDAGQVIATEHRYDAAGQEHETEDALGHIAYTDYDAWGRPIRTRMTDEDHTDGEGTREYAVDVVYDGMGNPVLERDARGVIRETRRDVFGRVTTTIDGEEATTVTHYDVNDRAYLIVGPRMTRHVYFDDEGRETRIVEAEGLPEEREMFVLQRDAMGNPERIRDWRGQVTELHYDDAYRVDIITGPDEIPARRTLIVTPQVLSPT
jgi:YD repeat-containing protein